jgi:hypothetical protein
MDMPKILMVLTHNRLDCLLLNLDMLDRAGALTQFDRVVLLLNGVSSSHLAAVDRYMASHPSVKWDKLFGPGTRPAGLVGLQNECVRKYPDAFYIKTDEDVFVPRGWAERMFEAYEANRSRDNLALITPLIPNNAYGLYTLLTRFYPELLIEHRAKFGHDPSPERQGFTWQSPDVAAWSMRKFLDIDASNERHRGLASVKSVPRYHAFQDSFSVGCIGYDYRHWKAIGGVPPRDEPEWCELIAKNNFTNILDQSQIVLHYSFFVQQDWLDRTTLLEEIRHANLPGSCPGSLVPPHWCRFAKQLPSILRRRLLAKS